MSYSPQFSNYLRTAETFVKSNLNFSKDSTDLKETCDERNMEAGIANHHLLKILVVPELINI